MCGEATHGESKHTLSCSAVTHTAYIYLCALAVLRRGRKEGRKKEREKERRQKRKNEKRE